MAASQTIIIKNINKINRFSCLQVEVTTNRSRCSVWASGPRWASKRSPKAVDRTC